MPSESLPVRPQCGEPLTAGGLVLCRREDDERACRSVWSCSSRHVWWRWADRPSAPLEHCPHPGLFAR